jgi:hypothetical protein
MRTTRRFCLWPAVVLMAIAFPALSSAQETRLELAPMARLLGGQSITAKSYVILPGGEKLVSEGTLRGDAVAIDTGLDVFEYTVKARGDTLVMGLGYPAARNVGIHR